MSRLLWYDKRQFRQFLRNLVETRDLHFLITFFHGYLAFCSDPTNPFSFTGSNQSASGKIMLNYFRGRFIMTSCRFSRLLGMVLHLYMYKITKAACTVVKSVHFLLKARPSFFITLLLIALNFSLQKLEQKLSHAFVLSLHKNVSPLSLLTFTRIV